MSLLSILPHHQRPLRIERVDQKNYQKIKRIAEDWQLLAHRKIGGHPDKLDTYGRLIASSTVARAIALECYMMNSNPALAVEWQKEIYACKDEGDQVQGIALVTKNLPALRVDYVMTNPANIRCKANESEPGRVEGAGRAFCAFLEKEAPKEGIKSVYLNALPPSIPFYLKFGFTQQTDGKMGKSLTAKL